MAAACANPISDFTHGSPPRSAFAALGLAVALLAVSSAGLAWKHFASQPTSSSVGWPAQHDSAEQRLAEPGEGPADVVFVMDIAGTPWTIEDSAM